MTYASVLDGALQLVQASVPELTTLGKIEDWPQLSVPQDQATSGALLLGLESAGQTLITFGTPGLRQEEWDLQGYLWAFYNPAFADGGNDGTQDEFLALVESVRRAFELQTRMNGLCDTATTHVVMAGETMNGLRTKLYPAVRNGATAQRNAQITVHIVEHVTPA